MTEFDTDRIVVVGRRFFTNLADEPDLNAIELPDGLGICLVHRVRGGGKVYVAPDETVLFVPSAVDFEVGLRAFRDGMRTPADNVG